MVLHAGDDARSRRPRGCAAGGGGDGLGAARGVAVDAGLHLIAAAVPDRNDIGEEEKEEEIGRILEWIYFAAVLLHRVVQLDFTFFV